MKRIYLGLCTLIFSAALGAKSLGVVGEVFPVVELSFLELIEQRLKQLMASGDLEKIEQNWLKTVAAHADRPKSLGLPRASRSKEFHYRPETVLAQDIYDAEGRLLFAQGLKVNALEKMQYYKPCWLFFNADDQAQILWVEKTGVNSGVNCVNPKLILTQGSVSSAEKRLQAVIYFDQAGRITEKLAIKALPARVMREGNALRIEEIAIGEDGYVL